MGMRIIGHLDMDAFFAAIEERDNPRFRGLPIVIGADPKNGLGRGVVSTANYKAREYGIHSAMPITRAWRAASAARQRGEPAAIFLPVDMAKYQRVSRSIMEEIATLVPVIEQTSVDEAYLDLSFCGSFKQAEELARKIKKKILKKERLTASVGIGPNKLMAKIASDMQKPDGLTVIVPGEVERILEPMPIRKIPGIGPKTETYFKAKGVQTVADLKTFSEAELYEELGKWGLELYEKIRGRDESPLVLEWTAKSIG
ncbi:MAG TPA: DNA polymerase IV, partial [Candidatus Paceibacterota bacterium]|nr:DNA polymerase IV [Candidatus Paceibacterota bacterium]